jgi:hypothetical protein
MSGCGGCNSCDGSDCEPGPEPGPLADRGSGEKLAEPVHHDCCWFARHQNRVEFCQKRDIDFVEDIHGNLSDDCRNCGFYAYIK